MCSLFRTTAVFVPAQFLFLEKVRPQVAVFSCGADNVFHVPHPDVLERFKLTRSRIYRTDRDGAVAIETDGKELRTRTFLRGNP